MTTFLYSGTLSGTLPLIAASVCSPAAAAASRAADTSIEYTAETHVYTGDST